jgi:membrane protease YdiL (CAAX protease family)
MQTSRILFILFFLLIVCGFAGGLIMIGLLQAFGLDQQHWQQAIDQNATLWQRDSARIIALLNNLTTFFLPAFICAIVVAKKEWYKFLKINVFSNFSNAFFSILIMLISIPLIQYTYNLNQQLPMPSWMKEMEASTEVFIKGILRTEHTYEFWFNIVLFAVIPAFSEEFFFRGIIQTQLKKMFKDPHLAIWAAAFIFSSIHFQFAGFVPRILLGGVLGYVFYFTGSLWMPILGHFTNNAMMVVAAHLYQTGHVAVDLEKQENFPWYLGLLSLLLTLGVLYKLEKNNEARLIEEEKEDNSISA